MVDPVINAIAEDGSTPLCLASEKAHIEVVKLLIKKGASVNRIGCGLTPLIIAIDKGEYGDLKVARVLVENGADINVQVEYYISILNSAVKMGDLNFVKLLIEKGANVNIANVDGITPFHEALNYLEFKMAKILIKSGATLNVTKEHAQKSKDSVIIDFLSAQKSLFITPSHLSFFNEPPSDSNSNSTSSHPSSDAFRRPLP